MQEEGQWQRVGEGGKITDSVQLMMTEMYIFQNLKLTIRRKKVIHKTFKSIQ